MSSTLDALRPVAGDGAVGPGVESNIADVAVDRHVRSGHGADTALRWIGRDRADLDDPVDFTYAMLATRSARFAGALRDHGVAPGTAVATLLGRVPDLHLAALGTWKARCVFTALSASAGSLPIADRLHVGEVAVLVTTPTLFRRTVAPILNRLPDLRLVLICGASEDQSARTAVGNGAEVMSCGAFLRESTHDVAGEATDPDEPATLHFTTTIAGRPTAVVRSHRATAVQNRSARLALGLHRGDTYWCATDPGWVHGVDVDIIGAMPTGATSIVEEADFDAGRWRHILRNQHVDVLCTTPSALRTFRRAMSDDDAQGFDLRVVGAAGEPVDPTTAAWARSFFGAPVLDTRWQTEMLDLVDSPRAPR